MDGDAGMGMEASIRAGLTDAQREAVLHTEGPLLVLAAAGSGKTRVITRRIAYLISLGIPAWQILALTFTNKAAGEMRERVADLLETHPDSQRMLRGLTVSTFHALCARLLRRYLPLVEGRPDWRLKPDYVIYDTSDQTSLMKRVLEELNLSASHWQPRSVLSSISDAKNRLEDPETFAARAANFQERTIASIYPKYDQALRQANAVDFDDLMVQTVRLLRTCDEARAEVQDRWRYLLIDEYQDTNHAQFVLSTLLCGRDEGRSANVCAVGDPDQSIYGWRGADIANILDFEAYYPDARVIALGENFRSSAPILAAADALIRNNVRRKHKDLFTSREGGSPPTVVLCRDERHESTLVTDWFRRLEEEGDASQDLPDPVAWKDMAVFYRNNALSRVMEDALRRANVPYVIARGTAFYEREEVRDALAYLRLASNLADDVSLLRIVNKPTRKIGKATIQRVDAFARERGIPLFEGLRRARQVDGLGPAAIKAVGAFVDIVDDWTGHGTFMGERVDGSLAEFVSRVVGQSGLEKHYAATDGGEERVANLEELVSAASEFESRYVIDQDVAHAPTPERFRESMSGDGPRLDITAPPLLAMLRGFLESVALVADADRVDPANGAVTLMTLHAAKGLEFKAVAIIGAEEGILPGMRAMERDEDLEEERRLCFVGITRAMRALMMTSAQYRMMRGQTQRREPSRFINELPQDGIVLSDQSGAWVEEDEFDQRPLEERRGGGGFRGRGGGGGRGGARGVRLGGVYEWIAEGVGVRHPQFGVGRVLTVTGSAGDPKARIAFQDCGTKTIVLRYASLEPYDLSFLT
ncbi:MAG: UvrD-helicase domain-containing protein [Phycisphaerales bacterium]